MKSQRNVQSHKCTCYLLFCFVNLVYDVNCFFFHPLCFVILTVTFAHRKKMKTTTHVLLLHSLCLSSFCSDSLFHIHFRFETVTMRE